MVKDFPFVLSLSKHSEASFSNRMLRVNWWNSQRAALLCVIIVLSVPLPGAAQTIKVPYVSISGFQAPLYLGERAGLFKKNQLDAQLIYMPGGSLIVQTLLSGEVGIGSLAPPSALSAWARGAELAIVAGGIDRALNVLMVNPKIKRVDDLRGKRVAISRFGSLSDVSLRDALAYHKLKTQEISIAQMGGLGERMVALTSGVVDGAILNVDQVYQAEKLGFYVLIDMGKLPLNYSTQGIVVSRDFLRAQRGVVKRFLRVYIEGIKVFKTDRELSIATLGRYIKTNDREVLAKTYDFYRDAWESVPTVRREGIQQALDSIPEGKNAKLNVDNLIDNSLIQELDKEGFLRDRRGQALKAGINRRWELSFLDNVKSELGSNERKFTGRCCLNGISSPHTFQNGGLLQFNSS